ncbi:Unknown protein sequence [Pseudomonas syringae pv. spinaceae]|uniref:Uncharacterized protein n=1 Tax=Pseudomonas syringae pv. spinaceae TaxID=264459 RepID=A0A0P9Z798_PSESX|nr:Unknown protein sequence [Pseudomonas syringae pv. spinaceae]
MKRTARLLFRLVKIVAGSLRRHLLKMPADAIVPLFKKTLRPCLIVDNETITCRLALYASGQVIYPAPRGQDMVCT